MSSNTVRVPDVCVLGYHISGRAKNVNLGDKLVPSSGPYAGIAVKVIRIERREVLLRARPVYQFYFYCNRV